MFTLTFETDNDAFMDDEGAPNAHQEIARILRRLADQVEAGQDDGRIYDINGNRIGAFELAD